MTEAIKKRDPERMMKPMWRVKALTNKALCLLVMLAVALPSAGASAEIKPLPNIDVDVFVPVPIVIPINPDPPKPEPPPTTSLRWSLPTGAKSHSAPVTAKDGTVYFVGNGTENLLYALNPDGSQKWKYSWSDLAYQPSVGPDGTIYVGSADGYLYALRSDGSLFWKTELKETSTGPAAFGADGTVYVTSNKSSLFAIRSQDGAISWKFPLNGTFAEPPAVGLDGTIYTGVKWTFYAVKPNGTLKWSKNFPSEIGADPYVGRDGTVYVGTLDSSLRAFSGDGTAKWTYTLPKGNFRAVSERSDGTIYAGDSEQNLRTFAADGKELWTASLIGSVFHSPVIGPDGVAYAATDYGRVHAVNPDGKIKWQYSTGEKYAPHSLALGPDGTVYSAIRGIIFAIGTKGASSVGLNKTSVTLEVGQSDTLVATVSPADAVNKKVVWSSDNSSIASVDDSGKVIAVSAGQAKITAKSEDGGFIAIASVTVMPSAGTPPIVNPPVIIVDPAPVSFSDTSGHWAQGDILSAYDMGITKGYPDGTFRPEGRVTRAEFTVMLMNGLKPSSAGGPLAFKDKAKIGKWAETAIGQAVALGIVAGYPDKTFRPDANITHAEMLSMIAKAAKLPLDGTAVTAYADDADIPKWARGAVAAAEKRGIIVVGGRSDKKLLPLALTTRAEAASAIVRMLTPPPA